MSNYKTKLEKIKAFAFDVDGVLTSGAVICFPQTGDLIRTYDAKDGFGLRMALMKGFVVGIITGGEGDSIIKRFIPNLATEVYTKSRDKLPIFAQFCKKYSLRPEEVAFVGDDLPDLEIMANCGLAVAPSDAVQEVKAVADYVSLYPGGRGCVRDLIEQVLKVQGKWDFNPAFYDQWRKKKGEEFEKLFNQ